MKSNDNENLYPHQNIFPNGYKMKEKLMTAQLCGAKRFPGKSYIQIYYRIKCCIMMVAKSQLEVYAINTEKAV